MKQRKLGLRLPRADRGDYGRGALEPASLQMAVLGDGREEGGKGCQAKEMAQHKEWRLEIMKVFQDMFIISYI